MKQGVLSIIFNKIKHFGVPALIASMLLLPPALYAASNYELGVAAYQNNQFAKAREHWNKGAAEGNISAIFNLGILLSKGVGGTQDLERAAVLFKRAGDAGLAMGQHNLALAYYAGKGVLKNSKQARFWWERAARQGHTQAQFNLGALLWNGDGVNKDANQAIIWFRQASDAGHIQARTFLETIFDETEFAIATEAPANEPAAELDPKLSSALNSAGDAYTKKDYSEAFSQWNNAASMGNADAQYQVARLYQQGLGVAQDPAKAFEFIQLSANNGQAQAQYELAQYYLQGNMVDKNETLALYWMQSAADNKHIKARDYLEQLR